MHYFLFNLSPKNHLRSTVFFFIKLLLMHIPCSSTDLGWYNSSPINCMWLIDLLRHLQRPFLFFCFKNHTGLKYFLRVHSAVSDGQLKKTNTVFPHIVAAATILFWIHKSLKISHILFFFGFGNPKFTVHKVHKGAETIQGRKLYEEIRYSKLLWQRFPSNPGLQIQIPELSSHFPWFEHELSPGQNISEMKHVFGAKRCYLDIFFKDNY